MNKILLITMGGTIDAKAYKKTPKKTIPLLESIIPDALLKLNLQDNCNIYEYCNLDSKDISKELLFSLAEFIKQQHADKIIITQGTDILVENARKLLSHLKNTNKTIVITGAMIPLMNEIMGYGKSDGYSNLSFSFEQVKKLKSGVYIAFHNKVFDPHNTKKDFKKKKFIDL